MTLLKDFFTIIWSFSNISSPASFIKLDSSPVVLFGALATFGKARAHMQPRKKKKKDSHPKKMCCDVTQVFCIAICKFLKFFICVNLCSPNKFYFCIAFLFLYSLWQKSSTKVVSHLGTSTIIKYYIMFFDQSLSRVSGLSRTRSYKYLWVSGFLDF